MKKLLRKGEVAALLDVTVAAINKMVCERRIPYIKPTGTRGGSVRFDPDAIEEFLKRNSFEMTTRKPD